MIPKEIHDHVLELLQKLKHGTQWKRLQPGRLFELLRASDCLLMKSYLDATDQAMRKLDSAGGVLDAGGFLYLLHHPPPELIVFVKLLVKVLELAEGMPLPASQFTPETWQAMLEDVETQGIVGPDGSIFGKNKYEQLDAGWLLALAMLAVYELGLKERHKFGKTPRVIETPVSEKPLRIAIVGDWGTGPYGRGGGPADAVMRGIDSQNPDYIIHLGDVYYAGTEHEEKHNFLKHWSKQHGNDNALTLNSNHEMYDGANGYFNVALKDGGPFSAQQQTSFFAIRYGDWLLLGLDSAFHSEPEKLYMNGSIGKKSGTQAIWIQQVVMDCDPQKTIVLTHHNPVNTVGSELVDGGKSSSLWGSVCHVLGDRPPDYWYFGHIHNGIVYSDTSAIGKGGSKGRLVGHGAIPYGLGTALPEQKKKGILEYFAQTRIKNDPPRVRNGFAIIELDAKGGIEERFYEIGDDDTTPEQVWP